MAFFRTAAAQVDIHVPSGYDGGLLSNWFARNVSDGGSQQLLGEGGFFGEGLLGMLRVGVGALAILFLVIIGAQMVLARGDADALSKLRMRIIWVGLGLLLFTMADTIAFDLLDPTQNVLDSETTRSTARIIMTRFLTLIQYVMGGFVLVQLLLSGYALITGSGDAATQDQERNFIQSFVFGLFLVLFAEVLVLLISLPDVVVSGDPGSVSSGAKAAGRGLLIQLMGVVRFMNTLLVASAVLLVVWGAVFYASAWGNEARQEQGKRIVIGAVVAIILVISSYTLASFLLN